MTVRIANLDGGIGGLATAAFLRRAGLTNTVYEQATALTQVGAGLLVTPNAARLLGRLGVLGKLREHALRLDVGWEFRRWQDGTVLSSEDLSQARGGAGRSAPPSGRGRPGRRTGNRTFSPDGQPGEQAAVVVLEHDRQVGGDSGDGFRRTESCRCRVSQAGEAARQRGLTTRRSLP